MQKFSSNFEATLHSLRHRDALKRGGSLVYSVKLSTIALARGILVILTPFSWFMLPKLRFDPFSHQKDPNGPSHYLNAQNLQIQEIKQ